MRIIHIIKTVDGAQWALDQVIELLKHNVDVHVLLPTIREGVFASDWLECGAKLHPLEFDFSLRKPWKFFNGLRDIRKLVNEIKPDIIHSHFLITTVALRYALGKNHPTKRLFQVPGPAHLEYLFLKKLEISSAGINDYWIASSRYTYDIYIKSGIEKKRLFLSYYGNRQHSLPKESSGLKAKYRIHIDQYVIGNINYMYSPKIYLGQIRGIKRHEDVIDAIADITSRRDDVMGLIIGGQWGNGDNYEKKLIARANSKAAQRIILTGKVKPTIAKSAWVDFDVAIHVPTSENCGGVIEPLLAGVPVIAAKTGGLPEVIIDGVTGLIVNPCNPNEITKAIETILSNMEKYKNMAQLGKELVTVMFDVKRTALEVVKIYDFLLKKSNMQPIPFDSKTYLQKSIDKQKIQN